MRILQYRDLEVRKDIRNPFDRVVKFLAAGDFRAADVRKMRTEALYRARLNHADRLLFRFARWRDETCLLLLEVVYNHAYGTSRFLRGAEVDEAKIEPVLTPPLPSDPTLDPLVYLHPERPSFHFLDRVLSFDDLQAEAYGARPPVIIIGSAGSGKTVLTLEKVKDLTGDVLYVTRSPYLAEGARDLYYAAGYLNEGQTVEFLSLQEFMESIRLPTGRPLTYRDFEAWFARHRSSSPVKDTHRLYEEFGGVLTGTRPDCAWLSREEYLTLGIRQSIFLPEERGPVYELFEKYLRLLRDTGCYDLNIAAFDSLPLCQPQYDYAVVDEVQDLTVVQIQLILKALRNPQQVVLCGDSNQIVHPNFFSWAKVKSFFYRQQSAAGGQVAEMLRVLDANYRNSLRVTGLANRLLRLKGARFGSIDRESNYLVRCCSTREGTVELLPDSAEVARDLNQKTRRSARCAVLVMRPEDKPTARRVFETPLVFSVQEAKGLEYDDIVLYNLVSGSARPFEDISEGMSAEPTEGDLRYARARDKSDKSLEVYKFYANSLYVAITRAVENLYVIEAAQQHPLLALLGLVETQRRSSARSRESSREEWQREARRLEQQGKTEQAEDIRQRILGTQPVPWQVVTPETLPLAVAEALDPQRFNRKAKDLLFDYACVHGLPNFFGPLLELKYSRAREVERTRDEVMNTYLREVRGHRHDELYAKVARHGVDFRNVLNQTPLMLAAYAGNEELARRLVGDGADLTLRDNWGRTALQVALRRAYLEPPFAAGHIGALYELLAPASIRVRLHDRLVKIDRQQIEFFILNCMIALLQEVLDPVSWRQAGVFACADFLRLLEVFPDRVVPPWRKKRSYVNGVLARNEVRRPERWNRELLYRVQLGKYVLNPLVQIEVGESWQGVYKIANLSAYSGATEDPLTVRFAEFVQALEPQLTHFLDQKRAGAAEAAGAGPVVELDLAPSLPLGVT